jgi:hypothetical protein
MQLHVLTKFYRLFEGHTKPQHIATSIKRSFQKNTNKLSEWSSRSPDLNVTENIWTV